MMNLKKKIRNIVPASIRNKIPALVKSQVKKTTELRELNSVKKIEPETSNLLSEEQVDLNNIFYSTQIKESWEKSQEKIKSFNIPDLTGGINPGDRKAIFFLIRHFKPKAILEIGTHIGASTVNIAAALDHNKNETKMESKLKTLDIRDVNSQSEKPWVQFGMEMSPIEMIKKLKYESFVEFMTDTSLNYLENTNETFDFIFLDGDHSAKTVYKEIPLALNKLNKGGVVLLHDYFPNGKPLWSNNSVIYGPYLACQRHIAEGANICCIPLGSLPWPTKLNSNCTSLALLLKQ